MSSSSLTVLDRETLTALCPGKVFFDEPMKKHTTLRIGGPADAFITPESEMQMRQIIEFALEKSLPITPVGAGSNLLVRDGGVRGLVIATKQLRKISHEETRISVEAGVSTGKLLASATQWHLGGVEFLGGVPGSVGGGMVMNAGTYVGEFKDVTVEVTSIDITTGKTVKRDNAACQFVYRGSALPKHEIVLASELKLVPRDQNEIMVAVRELKDRRKEREPSGASNAGSVFKNPAGQFAGRMIEATGLKGTRVGDAECAPKHANWFVNHGNARAKDMFALIEMAREKVQQQFGITLELEWKVIGDDE